LRHFFKVNFLTGVSMKQTNGKAKTMRFFAYAAATVVVALMATACGKKDEGGGAIAVVPVGVGASCASCTNLSGLVASGLGVYWNASNQRQAEISVQFFGEATAVAAAQNPPALYYRGQVGINGTLRVLLPSTTGCVIPAGAYTLQTTSPGQWQGEQFGNIAVTATGPVTLQLQFVYGFISGGSPAITDLAGATFPYRVRSDEVYVVSSSGGGLCSPRSPYTGQPYPEFLFNQ
jgi:hypothetical protein